MEHLNWFNTFLSVYNGVSFFQHDPSKVVHVDAGPHGLGAIFDVQVYALSLPIALKLWHAQWTGLKVQI